MDRDSGWFKSSYSGSGSDTCVEVRIAASIGVRDTKNRDGGTLRLPPTSWSAFLAGLAAAPIEHPPGRRR
jgi:hypothetical protein